MLLQDKKGISIMIGYVLLIVFAVILGAIIFVWLRSYVPSEALNCPDGVSVFAKENSFNDSTRQFKLTLKNSGRFNIAGFFIHGTNISGQEIPTVDFSPYLTIGGTNKSGNSVVYAIGQNLMSPADTRTNLFDIPSGVTIIPGETYTRIIPVRYQVEGGRNRFVSCGDASIQQLVTVPLIECVPTISCVDIGYSCNPPGWNQSDGCNIGALNCGGCSGGQSCNSTGQCETPPVLCGNGVINVGEQCDNGTSVNVPPGTLCSPSYGGSCTSCSNLCEIIVVQGPRCGDGIIQTSNGEVCDDGNTNSGDGCSASCQQVENGWICTGEPSQCEVNPDPCNLNCRNSGYSSGQCIPQSQCTGDTPFTGNTFCGAGQGRCCCTT